MTDQGIKSRPSYSRLEIDRTGKRHLLLAGAPEIAVEALSPDCSPLAFDERWTIASHSRAIPSISEDKNDHAFRSEQHLLIALRRRLSEERMGLRLYAIGTEPFLWNVNAAAQQAGMGREEIKLCAYGSGARRVYCNHCRAITPGVTTNLVACSGCGATLFVRDHFSRRLNAFAGVQVDAEVPGEVPRIEELYA